MLRIIAILLLLTSAAFAQQPDLKLSVCHQQLSLAQTQLENVVAQYEAQIAELKKQLEEKANAKPK